MALTLGVNSWVTVAQADAFLGDRIGTAPWFALEETATEPGEESKETYLTTAYQWLSGAYGIGADAAAPQSLQDAQTLAANWLIGNREDYEKRESLVASGVEEFEWSRWNEKLGDVAVPRFISDLMIGLGIGGANAAVQLYGDDYDR